MHTISSSAEITAVSRQARHAGKRVGFVPTMGALHAGHLSLVRAARSRCDVVVVSIFVNPTQFGPNEDFSKYPRTFDSDCAMLEKEKADYVFHPSVEEMYPAHATTWVTVEGLSEKLDGGSRPGHFRGVTTIVSKLFHVVQPDMAFFGQKDAAQAAIIQKMVRDLDFDLEIVVCPTVREADGLAMSSRNAYLNPEQRRQATVLYRTLMRLQMLVDKGERKSETLIAAGKQLMAEEPSVRLDYLEIVDPDTLDPVTEIGRSGLIAVAAWVGSTRLIDNIVVHETSAAAKFSP
jgi:pantoate--beta-alanine ligase